MKKVLVVAARSVEKRRQYVSLLEEAIVVSELRTYGYSRSHDVLNLRSWY
jgi:hypothetical protein